MSTQIAVEIRQLTKTIGHKTIVENLSVDIPKGEVFGLLGPNGAGKTTTIRMMVGLISKSQGQVLINGIDVEKHFSKAMQHVGAIVENPELYKFLTGYQNLKHFARMSQGVNKARIDEVVKLVGLEQRINDKVKKYSLGMRQRLGLAQALLRNPDVLILDEPTNGLDPAGIRELRDHLRSLAKSEGISVIVSSHLLSEMELMCDRVAIIQNGKLVDVKTVREMVSNESEEATWTELSVDESVAATKMVQERFPSYSVRSTEGSLQVLLKRDAIPALLKSLLLAEINVYSVKSASKSLEDKFLEITGGGNIA